MSKILVVEDDREALDAYEGALRSAGFDVLTAATGGRALAVAREVALDIVLADLRLSDMSGLDVLNGLHGTSSRVPFVIITAFGTIEVAVEAMKRGAADFVEKPVPLDDLVLIVRAAVSNASPPTFTPEHVTMSRVSDRRVHRALEIIRTRHCDPQLGLSSVASELEISRCFLARLIKRETGFTFLYHLHRTRIRASEALLAHSTLSIKLIAAAVGYSTTGWFDRHFRRLLGIRPTEYRRNRS